MKTVLTLALLASAGATAAEPLRLCADPDNLPFSNAQGQGFENKIAELIGRDLHAPVTYTWYRQKQDFIRQTLGSNRCDVVMGVPAALDRVLTTQPYYRSYYVFVTKATRKLSIASYDDPALKGMTIGVHAIGNDGANSPPAVALGRHGLAGNLVGFSMWGEQTQQDPQGDVVAAVARGDVDAAIVWGPLGGYFASKQGASLKVSPAPVDAGMPAMPFAYDIALGVRKGDTARAAELQASLDRNRSAIRKILDSYHIPLAKADIPSVATQESGT